MVGIISAVRREVESDGEALLTRRKVTAIKGIAIFCRRETCILTDGPWALRVHGRVGAANIGRNAGIGVQVIEAVYIRSFIKGFDVNALG